MQPGRRMSAEDALKHPFLTSEPVEWKGAYKWTMGDFSGNLAGATFQNNIKQRKQIGKWKEKHGIALAKSAQDGQATVQDLEHSQKF